jgi:hypothetical protein
MSQDQVQWIKIPIVGLPEMTCQVPTTTDGRTSDADGEPLPLEERTTTCGADGHWMLGNVFLCPAHAAEVAEMLGDSIEAITEAWRSQL